MKRKRKQSKESFSEPESEEEDVEFDSPEDESDSEDSPTEFVDDELDSEESEPELDGEVKAESESDFSESEFDEDTKLPVLTMALSERLLSNAAGHSINSIKRLISVFSSVVGSAASNQIKLASEAKMKDGGKKSNSKLKFKYLRGENRRLLRGTAEKYSDLSKTGKKTYLVRDPDVYKTFVSKTFDVMSEYMGTKEVLAKRDEVLAVAPLVRRFLSGALVQLAFTLEDFDLTRSSLISLSAPHVVRWVCVFKHVNNQFVKIVSSLMCGHPQKLTRVNCYQFLSEYLKGVRDHKLMGVQLSPRSYTVNYVKLSDSERKEVSNTLVNFLLKLCYSSHVKSAMKGITLKNFGLYRLSQNCVVDLYLQSPYDNLYVHAFKSIRDLALNVRREWNSASLPGSKKKAEKRRKGLEASEGGNKSPKDNDATYMTVCSWCFIEAVNIWVGVLCKSNEKMRVLVYPLVTVVNSAIKIKISNTKYMPFVLHLLTSLNRLSDGVNKFIPIASLIFYLLENLKNFKQKKSNKSALEKSEDIMIKLRIGNKNMHSLQTCKLLYKHVELVLVDHLGIVSLNPSFPEFTAPVLHFFKNYLKSPSVLYEFKTAMNSLFKIMKESSAVITDIREELPHEERVNLKILDGSKVPMFKHRQQLLSKHQEMNKEKLLSTLQLGQL